MRERRVEYYRASVLDASQHAGSRRPHVNAQGKYATNASKGIGISGHDRRADAYARRRNQQAVPERVSPGCFSASELVQGIPRRDPIGMRWGDYARAVDSRGYPGDESRPVTWLHVDEEFSEYDAAQANVLATLLDHGCDLPGESGIGGDVQVDVRVEDEH